MAKSEEKLNSLLMKVKEESEEVGLKLYSRKTETMASCPITSCQIDAETVEIVADFLGGYKITAYSDYSHEIKKMLTPSREHKTTPGVDCGSDQEILIAKFRLKLKKVGKTIRPFRYDLNQIPYDYTVEVRNRFKGLDLIDRVPDELWMEVLDIVQETGIKTILKKKKCKKAKWVPQEALQIAVKRREMKGKGEM